MGDVKRSISLLCRLLNLCGLSDLAADDVRRAKFNKLSDASKLWYTLHLVAILLRKESPVVPNEESPVVPNEDHTDESTSHSTKCTCSYNWLACLENKEPQLRRGWQDVGLSSQDMDLDISTCRFHVLHLLGCLGFSSSSFWVPLAATTAENSWGNDGGTDTPTAHARAEDDTQEEEVHFHSHSRVLLIALFWLLGKFDMMGCLAACLRRHVENMTSFSKPATFVSCADVFEPIQRPGAGSLSPVPTLSLLLTTTGRLRSTCHALKSLSQDRARLTDSVLACLQPASSATSSATGSSAKIQINRAVSMDDVMLLYNRKLLSRACDVLASTNTMLALICAWQSMEETFWSWADSVLDEELKAMCRCYQSSVVALQSPSGTCTAAAVHQQALGHCKQTNINVLPVPVSPVLAQSTSRRRMRSSADHASPLVAYANELSTQVSGLYSSRATHSDDCQHSIKRAVERSSCLVLL